MAERTEKEWDELEEFFTKNTFKISDKKGVLMRNIGAKLIVIDDTVVPNYPNTKMFAAKKAPIRSFAKKELVTA